MKKSIISFTVLSMLIIGLTVSCRKEEQEDLDEVGIADASTQDDEESITKELFFLGSSCNYDFSQISGTCAVVTESSAEFPKTVTIDFGSGCTGPYGRTRKGKIIVEMSNPLNEIGATRTISFENFYVNDVAVSGTKTLTNSGLNDAGNLDVTVVGDITLTNGNRTRGRIFTHNREWIGHATCETADDEFKITGSGKVVRDAVSKDYSITTAVHVKASCRYPVSGVVDFGTKKAGAILDYGNGTCDEFATLTYKRKGTIKTINLLTRSFE